MEKETAFNKQQHQEPHTVLHHLKRLSIIVLAVTLLLRPILPDLAALEESARLEGEARRAAVNSDGDLLEASVGVLSRESLEAAWRR